MSYLYLKYLPTSMESTLEVLKGIHFETLFTFLILAFIISYSVLVTVYNFLLFYDLVEKNDIQLSTSIAMISFILLFGCYLVKSLSEKEFNLIAIFISFPFLYLIPTSKVFSRLQRSLKILKRVKEIMKPKEMNTNVSFPIQSSPYLRCPKRIACRASSICCFSLINFFNSRFDSLHRWLIALTMIASNNTTITNTPIIISFNIF